MKQLWDADELSQHWSLTFEELELLKSAIIDMGASSETVKKLLNTNKNTEK